MATIEEVKKELMQLVDMGEDLFVLAQHFEDHHKFAARYQMWYSRAYKLVQALAPERFDEFEGYYLADRGRKTIHEFTYVIQDYLKCIRPMYVDINARATALMSLQFQILNSLSSRIDTVIQDVTGHLFAELQDAELKAAAQLKNISKRAAGALAGVVLERHLQRVAANHNVGIQKTSPTIAELNDPLKQANVYDVPTWRQIQWLGDIRNLCSHKKLREPTDQEVDDLLSGVDKIVKTIF